MSGAEQVLVTGWGDLGDAAVAVLRRMRPHALASPLPLRGLRQLRGTFRLVPGMRMAVRFEDVDERVTLVHWQPADGETGT